MNYSFTELKKKTVINISNGKKLGKITDITVSFPKCCLESFTVSPCFCFFSGEKTVLTPCDIEKIGEDAVLVKFKSSKKDLDLSMDDEE